ncbi:MAG TPA: VOC family protein [Solirubrobacterales bacterium]|jgi:catechol 2,3-dioxygenase-like lactoylglutathione lyase family enzyme|nr:VOC family protein [Solirubrobacterales bacterium]
MLDASKAYNGFAVNDLEKAKQFYGETLGLEVAELDVGAPEPLLELRLGNRQVLIYSKSDLEPANYTILNFPVEDVGAAVDELAAKGITFERYDGFDQDEKGIDRNGPAGGIAWFKDPAGNILSVHGEM